eukprot:6903156-Alexandrium_andersonii.AAC.1
MSASLVGSEMCIRDREWPAVTAANACRTGLAGGPSPAAGGAARGESAWSGSAVRAGADATERTVGALSPVPA